jgi:hypothetical protein
MSDRAESGQFSPDPKTDLRPKIHNTDQANAGSLASARLDCGRSRLERLLRAVLAEHNRN